MLIYLLALAIYSKSPAAFHAVQSMGILQLPCDKTLRARVYVSLVPRPLPPEEWPGDEARVYVQTGKFTKVALLESSNCYDEFKAKRLTDGMVSQKAYSHL